MKRIIFGAVLLLTVAFLVSATGVGAQSIPQDADVDVTFELQSDGRLHYLIEISSESAEEPALPTSGLSDGSASVDISSPSLGQLDADASASLTFVESELTDQMELAFNMLSADMINEGVPGTEFSGLSSYEGQFLGNISFSTGLGVDLEGSKLPSSLSDLKVEELSCTEYGWDKPQFGIGFTASLSGSIFENEKIRSELPVSIEVSFAGSESSLNLSLSVDSPKEEMSLDLNSTGSDSTHTIEMTVEGESELPTSDGDVQWDLGLPEASTSLGSNFFDDFSDQLSQSNVSFTLKVPSGASVSGLPSGFQQEGNTYTWEGADAGGVLSSTLSGDTETQVSYQPSAGGTELPMMWIGLGVAVVILLAVVIFIRVR